MSTSDEKLPLSVLLFHAAMQRRMSLADFAAVLGLSVATLRSYLFEAGSRSRMRSKTVEQMAEILNIPANEVRERAELIPYDDQLFSEWLKAHMQGRFTRASLCTATKISDSAMKNYLNGQTTPDPDNAIRLAEVLDADSLTVARLIIASELRRRGVELPSAPRHERTVPVEPMPEPKPEPASTPTATTVDGATPTPKSDTVIDEATINAYNEQRLLNLWRRLHPQGRRATLTYIASLLAEGM
ncbi:MAG: XRE family transcriptional regulator [Chloroflexus aggregans]|uniref:XRE family transcriptional regulator n=1 Tax=Chloroflexus aggregans TaxID=152260 RepID=A0A2J6WZW9_9CHLR|nr:MAG: XRE family transcriptional regulator [Chloroflexus aggregans]